MNIHPGAQLAQEAAKQKIVYYPYHLARAVVLTTAYRDSSSSTLLSPPSASRLRIVSLDTTGCLESGKCHRTNNSDTVGEEVAAVMIARSWYAFRFPGCFDPPPTADYSFRDPLLPTPSNYHIAPTKVVANTPVRQTCFSKDYYVRPLSKLYNCSYCRRFRIRGISSHNIVHPSR
ncbi:hypothetical protein TNCV_492521 [Trichonephila clavipes]|nr:hypothetical protein TNCV_492521 [Trichonephila clavipes]